MLAGAPVQLVVTSATSEDVPTHAAANLTDGRPWRCEPGELYARVEFALVPPSPIGALIIGNAGAQAVMMHAIAASIDGLRTIMGTSDSMVSHVPHLFQVGK